MTAKALTGIRVEEDDVVMLVGRDDWAVGQRTATSKANPENAPSRMAFIRGQVECQPGQSATTGR